MGGYILVNTGYHTLKSLTGTTLCEVVSSIGNHRLYTLSPLNRAGQLCY